MEDGPSVGEILGGIFLILFGLGITLLGGACTSLFLSDFAAMFSMENLVVWPLFMVSLAILGGGIALVWLGIKWIVGGFNPPG